MGSLAWPTVVLRMLNLIQGSAGHAKLAYSTALQGIKLT